MVDPNETGQKGGEDIGRDIDEEARKPKREEDNEKQSSPSMQEEKKGEEKKSIEEIQKEFNTTVENAFQTIDGLGLEEKLRIDIESKLKQENPNLEPEQLKGLVEQELSNKTSEIRGSLRAGFNQILSAGEVKELNEAIFSFLSEVNSLLTQGLLSNEEARKLKEAVDDIRKKYLGRETISNLGFNNVEKELEFFRVQLTEKSKRIAQALFSREDFIAYLKEKEFLEDGKIKEGSFVLLYEEIRELFEEIISTVDSKPGQYFDNAFSYMYEGAYYNLLVQRLRKIGDELKEKVPELGKSKISIDDPRLLRYAYDSEKGAETRISYPGGQMIESFDRAVGIVLSQDMSKLLNIHRALHNAEFVVEEGAGFEELAKYVDQISINEIVWLFRTNSEVVEAYNLYLKNLIEELALNNWVIPTNFGQKDRENLDYAERLTVNQLLAKKGISGVREFYKTARTVRMASAISKAITGEFWSILMSSNFLIQEEAKEGKGKIVHIYTGTHQRGVEKMLSSIDVIKLWERFNLPSEFPNIKYVYIPRDLTHPRYQSWDHRRVYWVKEQMVNSLVYGPDEEFLEFMKENMLMGEVLRKPTLSILTRGGWRTEEYKAFIRKTKEGRIDFIASINNLMMVGTPAVRTFIDNLKFSEIDLDLIEDQDLRQALAKEDKDYLIKKYIFDRLLAVRPSKVLTLEKRLYTPRGEDLVIDDLILFFKEKYQKLDAHLVKDKILPLYLGGLKLAEDLIYRTRQKQAKDLYYKGEELKGDLFYEFKPEDINSPVVREALERFYDNFIKHLGREISYQGQRIDFSEEIKKEDFLTIMVEFLSKIRSSIERERKEKIDKKGEREKFTLSERFTQWLRLGFLNYEINGEDLDYGEFLINQAGARVHARAFTDAALNASKIVPNYGKIFEGVVINILKNDLGNAHQVEQFVAKNLLPLGKEICDTLKGYAGKDDRDKTAIQLMMLLERIVGRDSRFRTLFIGDLLMMGARNWTGAQGSLAQDSFPYHLTRPTFVPNIDQMYTMMHKFLNDMDVPFEEEKIIGYEEKKILGGLIKINIPKKEHNKYHVEQYEIIQGHSGWHRLKEKFLPLATLIALFVLIQLIREAQKKDKEK